MPSKTIEDFAYQIRDYMRGAEVVEGKNLAYSQENNAVIATIENGKSYKVRWTGSATVTLKKNSASGTEVTSGSTSPLSFTADSDFDLYFGSSADVTEIMVYDGNDTSDTYEPYYVPLKDSMFKRSEQRVLGAKNINTYPYSETTHTEANITFTVTDDGIVDIDGTSSGSTQFDFHRTGEFNNLKVGERYILSGAPDIEYLTEDVGLRLVIANDINTSQRQNIDCPQGGEIEFTIPTGWHFHWFTYRIASGKTFSHAKVKPMIRLASDPDDSYSPYAMTNKELTDAVTFGSFGSAVALTINTDYIAPSDGIFTVDCNAGGTSKGYLNNLLVMQDKNTSDTKIVKSIYVKKGMTLKYSDGIGGYFIPIQP